MDSARQERSPGVSCRCALVLVLALFASACDRPPAAPPARDAAAGERRAFTGTWSATGSRRTLLLEAGRRAAIFNLSGSLLLTGQQRIHLGFKADAIGLTDTLSGMQGRSVWTDEHGDKVFSELRGEAVGPGSIHEGRFVGGTGRYEGVSGEYTFSWQHLVDNEDGEVSGRVVGLKGWARLRPPAAPLAGERR